MTNIAPAKPIADNTTSAPAQLNVDRNGSPNSAPIQPPAFDIASTSDTMESAPLMTCKRPRIATTTTDHPIARRSRCSILRRRTMATPIPAITTGSANRPKPSNQPKTVSMASPKGPAIFTYIDNTNTMPVLISAMPQNSTSRPRTTSRAPELTSLSLEELDGRRFPFAGVFTFPRPDPLGPPDDEREFLPDMTKNYSWGDVWFGIPPYLLSFSGQDTTKRARFSLIRSS